MEPRRRLIAAGDTRTESITRDLRTRIIKGDLRPGAAVPTWGELRRHYDVTRTTLSRVFGRLKADGFVVSASTRGTFVAERPPHLCRYGLVFPQQPGWPGWNRFWWTVANEALVLQQKGEIQVPCFYGVQDHMDNESHCRLLAEVEADRLAGLILVGPTEMIAPSLRERTDLPIVSVGMATNDTVLPSIFIDWQSFIDKSLDYLAGQGRKRVAVVTVTTEQLDNFPQAAEARGMTHLPYWHLAADANYPATVRQIVRLLMSGPENQRPDALVISDDNLVEDAIAAVMATGLRVPDQLDLVTHCNWPHPVRSVLPARRLGYDAGHLLASAIELVAAKRRGENIPRQTLLPALFDDEL